MHTILVEKECGCFKRSDLQNNLTIESKDEALVKAIDMSKQMNDDFCGKHDFQVIENNNQFVIRMNQPQTASKSSGCCGGGCGTH